MPKFSKQFNLFAFEINREKAIEKSQSEKYAQNSDIIPLSFAFQTAKRADARVHTHAEQ